MQPSAVPYLVVPVIGPDGAGKSTLVRAMAELSARRFPGSVAPPRPVQMGAHASTVVDIRTPGAVVQLVDFADIRAEDALLGSTRFHAALLVVSAIDSVVPRTLDSLAGARERGIRIAAAVLTRCREVADEELVDLVTMEIGEMLAKHLHARGEIPVVAVDAMGALEGVPRWGEAVAGLVRAVGA
ncbi:MAG TPA: hypothetical protein VIY73_00215 [Polyangiaceae bacterium]